MKYLLALPLVFFTCCTPAAEKSAAKSIAELEAAAARMDAAIKAERELTATSVAKQNASFTSDNAR